MCPNAIPLYLKILHAHYLFFHVGVCYQDASLLFIGDHTQHYAKRECSLLFELKFSYGISNGRLCSY